MNKADRYLAENIRNILERGYKDENPRPRYADGTPAHTLSINHAMRSFDLSKGEFPITTLRPIAWKSAIKEILWIYKDASNSLEKLNKEYEIRYWNEWESKDMPNTIGARYGEVVRRYRLMETLLKELEENPYGRRHIIDLYQYKELEETDGLHPCAFLTMWNVRKEGEKEFLDMVLVQRSGDSLVASCSGVNEIQYAALLMMVARHVGMEAGVLSHLVANEQIYDRHEKEAKELLHRFEEGMKEEEEASAEGREISTPKLVLKEGKKKFYEFTIDDFDLMDYEPKKPQLKFELGI